MNLDEEYRQLRRMLPQNLTAAELAQIRTEGYEFPSDSQMMMKTEAVERDGLWYGAHVFIHIRGVVGHQVFPQGRQHKQDALDIADRYAQRVMDYHERMTGVRNRGVIEEDE